jgi:amino-acid N-acetyltransferase
MTNIVLSMMIRKAKITDVQSMQSLVNQYAESGQMLPRTLNELYEHLRDFHVFTSEADGALQGVCALHISWDGLAEIRSLAVRKDLAKQGIGSDLVRRCIEEASELLVEKVFVLTYVPDFFRKIGFTDIDKKELPHKIWTDCLNCVKFPNCDETALITKIKS